ncbi:MAG: protein-L-isoaspartate(D-aspartate) O-methyltransferase [Candidatus Thiodiazotropha sp.]
MGDLEGMLQDIRAEADYVCRMTGRGQLNDQTLNAMRRVPRQHFVSKSFRSHAYENSPLPIGGGQTLTQPFIVALMTDLVDPKPADKVLEVGTGSGYQTAILAQLAAELYTIEILPELAQASQHRLDEEGCLNIQYRIGDGYYGWPDTAPFDVIMVTAAVETIPVPLIQQLAPGGRMILPVGKRRYTQDLILLQKSADGNIHSTSLLPVTFVPLAGEHEEQVSS